MNFFQHISIKFFLIHCLLGLEVLGTKVWATQFPPCSSILERELEKESEQIFLEGVVSLFEAGIVELSDLEEIMHDPYSVLDRLRTEHVRTIGILEVLEFVLEEGIDVDRIAEYLARFVHSVKSDDLEKQKDESKTKAIGVLSEIESRTGGLSYKSLLGDYPVRLRWKGQDVIAVVRRWANYGFQLLDSTTGEVLIEKHIKGFRLGPVLDAIDMGSSQYLLIRADQSDYHNVVERYLLIYDLEKETIRYQIRLPLRSEPLVFSFYRNGAALKVYGFSAARLIIIEVEPELKVHQIEGVPAGFIFRRKGRLDRLRNESFEFNGERYLAFTSGVWYFLVNIDQAKPILKARFDDAIGFSYLVRLSSGRHLVFLARRDGAVFAFDPFYPEEARLLKSVDFPESSDPYWSPVQVGGTLAWPGRAGVIKLDLTDETRFNVLYTQTFRRSMSRAYRQFCSLLSLKKGSIVDVNSNDPIEVTSSTGLQLTAETQGIWSVECQGREGYLVVDGVSSNGTSLGRLDLPGRPDGHSVLPGVLLEKEGDLFLVVIDPKTTRLRIFKVTLSTVSAP